MGKGKFSRDKGKRGEREVVNLLQPVVNKVYLSVGLEPVVLERNLMQSHRGGHDIVGLDWLALEVKYQENIQVNQWWKQTVEQAGQDKVPVLLYRKSRVAWKVMLPVTITPSLVVPGVISIEAFILYFKNRLLFSLTNDHL